MRQIQWIKLNDTWAAVDDVGKLVGYILPLKRVIRPPETLKHENDLDMDEAI